MIAAAKKSVRARCATQTLHRNPSGTQIMSQQSALTANSKLTVGTVSPLLFGGFLEHMGRSIYEGIYEPDSPHADEQGFRTDVLNAWSELQMTNVRYPGGNFVSGYHWQDGIGPQANRPTVQDLAWQSLESNQVGTDEFLTICNALNWAPMLAVNLGTGTPEEARNWVEYCNSPTGTRFADMRAANGREAPYQVPYWCLGNEMDGPWQIGHLPAEQYAIRAQQAAKMMRDTDSLIETVACGSSFPGMASYITWDQAVLEYVTNSADYISLHRYVGNRADDTLNFLAVTNSIDHQIETIDAVCRTVAAKHKLERRHYLCFDEWNVWYKARSPADTNGRGQHAPHLIEEVYNLEDALVVAGFLMSFIRHADIVKIANIAQMVNVIAPVLTTKDALLKQSIFYAFRMVSDRKGGLSLQTEIDGDEYLSESYGAAKYLDRAVTIDGNKLNIFLTNRSSGEHNVQFDFDRSIQAVVSAEILTAADAKTANSFETPDRVVSAPFRDVSFSGASAKIILPRHAFAAITLLLV
jgi:alpha-L-arabinofuranosidase